MSVLTPELSQWLNDQRARGCAPDSLVKAMIEVGHPEAFARQVVSGASGAPAPSAPEINLSTPEARQHIMNSPNGVLASGHAVEVLFAMVSPRILLFGNVLSTEECDQLMALSLPKLQRSEVVDPTGGGTKVHAARTSQGTHFGRAETPLISRIEQRVAELTGIPVENQEPLQILRYGVGAEYEPHFDFFHEENVGEAAQLKRGGQRLATLIMYLNDVEAGGATIFPRAGVEAKPRKGHAVYFENVTDAGEVNRLTLHGGAPVGKGEKWIATIWCREDTFV
jgi:prolyl 4-hydroxylase